VLGCFAYWRYTLNDRVNSNNYVIALFVVATVPLIIQALSGQSGGNYGILLICQQVLFMLIGVILNQRFLLKAGLWIALGSILYQLRGLGWAFLGIVAVVLIAIAIYRLQKHEDSGLKN
jgi:formate hydrogenlyase subunit 3/multisubunit Na+/H+ antiporter MnhD subunit